MLFLFTMRAVLFVLWIGILVFFSAAIAIFSLPLSIITPTAIILLGSLLLSVSFTFLTAKEKKVVPQEAVVSQEVDEAYDIKKREFLKVLGSLGLGALLVSLFRVRDVSALSFGGTGVPDPIGIEPLGSSQTTGSVTLTDANTWYQVPSSNLTSRVFLVLQNRSGYDMYWTFDNAVSASTGGLLFPDGATLQLDAGADVNVYVRCGTAAQVCWYSESQSQ